MKKSNLYGLFTFFLLVVILVFPKINLFTISNVRNGVRLDDILLLTYAIWSFFKLNNGEIIINDKIKWLMKYFKIFIFFCFISSVLGSLRDFVSFSTSILYVMRKIEYFVFIFAGIYFFQDKEKTKQLFKVLNFIVLFHFIFSTLQHFNIIDDIGLLIGRPSTDRVYSTFGGPYELAAFFAIMGTLYSYYISKYKKYIYIPPLLLTVFCILISQSRISLIALGIIIAFNFIRYRKTKFDILMLFSGIFIGIVILLSSGLFNGDLMDRFKYINISSIPNTVEIAWSEADWDLYSETKKIKHSNTLLSSSDDLSFVYRISKWMTLLKGFVQVPLFGLGSSIVGEGMDGNFTRILCEDGIIGFFLMLFLLHFIIKQSKKMNTENSDFLYLISISLLITAVFIDIYEASKIMTIYWMFIASLNYPLEGKKI